LAETQETAKTEEGRLKSQLDAVTELLTQERTTFGATIHELTAQLLQERGNVEKLLSQVGVLEMERESEAKLWRDKFGEVITRQRELEEENQKLKQRFGGEEEQRPAHKYPKRMSVGETGEEAREQKPISTTQGEAEKAEEGPKRIPVELEEEEAPAEKQPLIPTKPEVSKEETEPLSTAQQEFENVEQLGNIESKEEQKEEEAAQHTGEAITNEGAEAPHDIDAKKRLDELSKEKGKHPVPAAIAGGRRIHQNHRGPHIIPHKETLVEKRNEKKEAENLGADAQSTERSLAKIKHSMELAKQEEKITKMVWKEEKRRPLESKAFPSTYVPPLPQNDNNRLTAPGGLYVYQAPLHSRKLR